MLKYNSSRHVYELDALTMVQVMARQAYTHEEDTKFKLEMASDSKMTPVCDLQQVGI